MPRLPIESTQIVQRNAGTMHGMRSRSSNDTYSHSGTRRARTTIMRRFLLTILAACGAATPTPKGGPRGLHANEHLDVALQHDAAARNASRWPDQRNNESSIATMPWTGSWDAGAEHERLAALHRSKAGALQAAYDEACATRSPDEVAVSPLQRYGIGGWNTSTGVILYLSRDAGPPDRLFASIKCHRAWMMLAASGMDDCPLDLPGIQLDARGDEKGVTLSIVIRDPKLVEELHRRASHDLESAAAMRSRPRE